MQKEAVVKAPKLITTKHLGFDKDNDFDQVPPNVKCRIMEDEKGMYLEVFSGGKFCEKFKGKHYFDGDIDEYLVNDFGVKYEEAYKHYCYRKKIFDVDFYEEVLERTRNEIIKNLKECLDGQTSVDLGRLSILCDGCSLEWNDCHFDFRGTKTVSYQIGLPNEFDLILDGVTYFNLTLESLLEVYTAFATSGKMENIK